MTRIVAIANQKGGVAKTTTAITLAAALVECGNSVLVVDLDAQACATFSLGIDPEDLDARESIAVLVTEREVETASLLLRKTIRVCDDGVHVVPATMELAAADVLLAERRHRERILAGALGPLRDDFDFIIVDCSPSLGLVTINALVAAEEVLIPLKCETLSHRGLGQLMETIDDVRNWANPDLKVAGLLPTLFDGRTAHAQAIVADLAPRYGVRVFDPIPRSIRFAEAPAVGRTILATAPRSAGARAYRALAQALLD